MTYALIIAVQNYNQPADFPSLKFVDNDGNEMKNSLTTAGVDPVNIMTLTDGTATKTAIEQEIQRISRSATDLDQIIFYFSGHGAYDSAENWILPVDTYNVDIVHTAVSINYLLGILKKSKSKRVILFLDCCHSGFEPGDDTKTTNKSFLADELISSLRLETYMVGFASCKSHERSITHPQLKHSVWTYFLLQALKGEAEGVYMNGVLLCNNLQTYLTHSTREYVNFNTTDRKEQTPVMFGNLTDNFVIADLNPVFDERKRKRLADAVSLTNVSMHSVDDGNIKSLPGFKSGHRLPDRYNYTTDHFVKTVGHEIVEEDISELSRQIREEMGYTIDEIEASSEDGSGTINTADFTYSVDIALSVNDFKKYIITRRLENFKESEIVFDSTFNQIFSKHFNELKFSFSKNIDIKKIIRIVEKVSNPKVKYNPSDLSSCILEFNELTHDVKLEADSLTILSKNNTNPQALINSFKLTQIAILSNASLSLLKFK